MRVKGPRKARFETIYQTGRRYHGAYVRLHVLPGTGFVGIATSRKVGTKPIRNGVKRRIRVLVVPHLNAAHDIVVLVNERASLASFEDLRRDVDRVFNLVEWISDGELAYS